MSTKESFKKMTPIQLMFTFISNVNPNCVEFTGGSNPFTIRVDNKQIWVYIKNLSPAQLSNNNPDVWRIQLPVKDEFEVIKESDSMFILLGYDAVNEVFTSWNPYWCKQRLNVGKSVSLYSRLSLQKNVSESGEIKRMDLNNDGDVVCIPLKQIEEYIRNIKSYYPEETTFVPKGSSIQKKLINSAYEVLDEFKRGIANPDTFRNYMLDKGMSERASKDYTRHVSDIITRGLVDKYKECFLSYVDLSDYREAVYDFLHIDEIATIDKKNHGYYRTGLRHYLDFLLSDKESINSIVSDIFIEEEEPSDNLAVSYPVDSYGRLTRLEEDIRLKLAPYVLGEDYPDYSAMIDEANAYYTKDITDNMSFPDWLGLFKSTNWKRKVTSKYSSSDSSSYNREKGSSKQRTKTIRVTRPDGTIVQNHKVVDTYEEIIKESFPDLISELKIMHAGVNIVSKSYDDKYSYYQREIGDGYLLMVNSSTEQKYDDLCRINSELELGLTVELVDMDGNVTPMIQYTKDDGSRMKIRVTFPNGHTIQYNKVLETLVEVVEYAGPERVAALNIMVCYENMMTRQPYEKYYVACKEVKDGWYVNTASGTLAKYNQICQISNSLNLGLIVELI